MPGRETISTEIIFQIFLTLHTINTKMPIHKGFFKNYQYSRTENPFKKTGFDRNILSQPEERNRKGNTKCTIPDDLKDELVEYNQRGVHF